MVTCWERAGLLALLYVMFYCVFVTFSCGVLGQVWYLIVSISDLCLLTYFLIFGKMKLLVIVQKKLISENNHLYACISFQANDQIPTHGRIQRGTGGPAHPEKSQKHRVS